MAGFTPMMIQYLEIKEKYKDCILFYRLGDFYEMFFEDALTASAELDIVLTGRDCGQNEKAPMCGVPFHSADSYIAKLVKKGYRVAMCEQIGDPKLSKTLVKREVVRVVSPGTIIDNNYLDDSKNNYIFCIYEEKSGFGISVCDVSTGEFLTSSFDICESAKIIDEIAKFLPSEIIVNNNFSLKEHIENIFQVKVNYFSIWAFEYANAFKKLCSHFGVINLNGFGIEDNMPAIGACGALIEYLHQTQMNPLDHINSIRYYALEQFMFLDISSRRNLEISETIRSGSKKGSLLWVLDKTVTSMGARLLRKWLEQPLIDTNKINLRLDSVGEMKDDPLYREEIKSYLNTIYDMERLLGRIVYQSANAKDLVAMKKSLEHLPAIKLMLMQLKSPYSIELFNALDPLEDVYSLINRSIVDEPPFSIREGGFIKNGVNADLDKYREAKDKSSEWLRDFEERQRQESGIKALKVKYNKVFGYYMEVTNSYIAMVPDTYIRRQTLANAERYTNEELKNIEDAILGADEKIVDIEYRLFVEIRNKVEDEAQRIQKSSEVIATVDSIASLGEAADLSNYIRPEISSGGGIEIKNGRHPVVEKTIKTPFIPNDTYMDLEKSRMSIITGPNMAGKSTYMRQVALVTLMAQCGSFVPADFAHISVCDRIFTRVGASDDLATGQSTFMVEMSEVANILNNATKNSLLILDEIGRGTSTFDGLSIAWSVLEYIADKNKIGAKTLFATHYHELTELEGNVDGVINYRVSVSEVNGDIIFLRKIERGGADRSYGIHVAKLAGIPSDVIERSEEVMVTLLHDDLTRVGIGGIKNNSEDAVYYKNTKKKASHTDKGNLIIDELKLLDVDSLTPRDALQALYKFKESAAKNS